MKSKSTSKNKSKKKTIIEEGQIDEIIKDITLIKPGNPFTQFVKQEAAKFREKNKDEKLVFTDFTKKCAEKWKKMSKNEKAKYEKMYEDAKMKYKSDLELVRHYIFKDCSNAARAPTAYRLFLNEKMREGFENDLAPAEVKKQAAKEWAKMEDKEKEIYKNKKKENDNWFEKAKNIKKVTPLSIFVQKTIESAKAKQKEVPLLKDIAPLWKSLPEKEKKKYEQYAREINDEKERLQDLYDITHGVKPKKAAGAYRIFLQEKAKENEIKNIQEGIEKWKKLSEEEKEEYLKKSHRCHLAYKYKKLIYNQKIKKFLPKKPGTALTHFFKEKKGQKPPEGEKFMVYWTKVYNSLPENQKKKYEEKAELAKEKYKKKLEQFKDRVFDMPKKPKSGFSLYVSDRITDLKQNNPNTPLTELIKQVAKEWVKQEVVSQADYNKQFAKDQARFKKQLKQFEKYGYYTKTKEQKSNGSKKGGEGEDDEEDEEDEDEKKRRKSSKKESSQKSKKSSQVKSQRTKKSVSTRSKSQRPNSTKKTVSVHKSAKKSKK